MYRKVLLTLMAAAMAAAGGAQTTMPATLGIDSTDAFAAWTVIDSNADVSPNTWTCGTGEAVYAEDRSHAADDWLIAPAVLLEAGVTYAIDYYIVQKSSFATDKQSYSITIGDAPTIEAQSTVLASSTSFASKLYSKQTATFTPAITGLYYLGVHLTSERYQGDCGFQKFVVDVGSTSQPGDVACTVPYAESFDTADAFAAFTTITNTTRGWTYYSSRQCAQFWGGTAPVDAWLITPGIEMTAGATYKVTFRAGLENAVSPSSYKALSLSLGQGSTAEALTTQLWSETLQSALMEQKTAYFTVPADGKWNLGFRVQGATNSYAVFVDDIAIVESQVIPQPATGLTVAAAAGGTLRAEVAWTNPATDLAGNALASLSKVELYRGDELLQTYADASVGMAMQYADEGLTAPGIYTYAVVAYADGQASERAVVASPWIGIDAPAAVTDLAVVKNADGQPVVSWTAPAAGAHGGYIDSSTMAYRIVRQPGDVTVAERLSATTFTDAAELPLAVYRYTVYATAGELTGEGATSQAIVVGGALSLPYEANLRDADEMALWTVADGNADGKTWRHNGSQWTYDAFSAADDYLFTPPLLSTAGKHRLTLSVTGYNYRYSDAFEVLLATTADPATAGTTRLLAVEQNGIQSALMKEYAVEFAAPAGTWHIALHDTAADSWGLTLGALRVERVGSALVGDLNGDGSVDVEDVNVLVNTILDKGTGAAAAADLDASGAVDVGDVNLLINIILAQ